MHRITWICIALLVALPAAADETAEKGPNAGHPGYALYQNLCSDCHGVRADGTGPKAALLDPPPPDLTRLRGPDGGPVRIEDLERVIDGRRRVRAHGEGKMPVWGRNLVSNEPNLELRERARIQLVRSLADYLLSIQRPPDGR